MLKSPFLFFFFCLLSTGGFSQQLYVQNYSMSDGLSDPGAYYRESILQDKEGFMWFSTFNGLNRFDGRTFKTFQFQPGNINSLPDNLCTGMCEADDGKIWISSGGNGLYVFDPLTEFFTHIVHDKNLPYSLCSDQINFVKKDFDGNMWIGTRFNGMCFWSIKDASFSALDKPLLDPKVFFQQKDGTIWVGGRKGLYKKLAGKLEFRNIPLPLEFQQDSFQAISDICALPDGSLLATTNEKGLWQFDPLTEVYKDMRHLTIEGTAPYCLLTDPQGDVWMSFKDGLRRFDQTTNAVQVFLNNHTSLNSLPPYTTSFGFIDNAGSLWFNNAGYGISLCHTTHTPFHPLAAINSFQILPIDSTNVVLSTDAGLHVFNIHTKQFDPSFLSPSFRNIRAYSMAVTRQHMLWVMNAETKQAHTYNLLTREERILPGYIRWLTSDLNGRMWSALKYWDDVQEKWIDAMPELRAAFPDFLPVEGRCEDIYFNDKKSIWIGSDLGLYHYNFETKTGKHYHHLPEDERSLLSNVVFLIYPGSKGRFYVWTSNGLSIYTPETDDFDNYYDGNGLLHPATWAVVEDTHGDAWIGSKKGLQKLDHQTKAFTNYTVIDGLTSNEVGRHRPHLDKKGFIYMMVGEDMIRFHPDSLPQRSNSAPLYLLDLFVAQKTISPFGADSILQKQLRYTAGIHVAYDQSDIGFSFVMPFYYKSDAIRYYYKLEPYHKDWQENGTNNEVHFTRLRPGKYTFKAKGITENGAWSSGEAAIDLRISPPWWKSIWAYLFYVLCFFSLLYGLWRYDLHRRLSKAETIRLKELDVLKSRLYTNITHEFRTPLTVIMGTAENLHGHETEKRLIRRNSKNLLRLINQLLDLSKLEHGSLKLHYVQGDIIIFLRYLTESFYSMAQEKNIVLTFYSEAYELIMEYDEQKIQHILYNLISNAIKFTPMGGKIIFHVQEEVLKDQRWLHFKVQDTGMGIAENHLSHIFDMFYQVDGSSTRKGEGSGIGLSLTKELVLLMGGRISVESAVDKGSSFDVFLPIHSAMSGHDAQMPFQQEPVAIITSAVEPDASNNTPSLLIIEDNKDVGDYIETLLKNEYQISRAYNGKEGIDKALQEIPDIIISDVMMPEKDGFEVCAILKENMLSSHIPIILLTARAEQKDKIEGLKHGADAYLMKPFDKEELFVRVTALLKLRKDLMAFYGNKPVHQFTSGLSASPSLEDVFLAKLYHTTLDLIGESENTISLLGAEMALSPTQLYRKLKAVTGKTPTLYIRSVRLQKASELLKNSDLNISEIAYAVGFNDPAYFSRVFTEEFGMNPSDFLRSDPS